MTDREPPSGGDHSSAGIDWDAFPVDAIALPTFLKRNLIHWNLLREALRRSAGGVLEIGVGSGAQSALLSRWVQPVATVDNHHGILRVARENLTRYGRGVWPVAGDAFRLPFANGAFGVGISQGLMEHFSDVEIGALLREQLRVCRSVVFSVPSNQYPRRDMGNERLLTPTAWRTILERSVDASRFRVSTRYYRGDLEAVKYSVLARRWLGSFSVLVTIDRRPTGW